MQKRNFLERALEGENQWWKYLLVFFMASFGGTYFGQISYHIARLLHQISITGTVSENLKFTEAAKNLSFGLMMLGPVTSLVFTVIFVKIIHDRNFSETVNGTKSVRWNRAFFAFAVGFVLMAIYWGIDYFRHSDNYVLQLVWSKFTVFFFLCIVLIPLMAASEELLFRGYLTQGIGAGTHSRRWALIIPTIIYGLMHFRSQEVREFGISLSIGQYLFFGFLFGLIAILDDGIELSTGLYSAIEIFPMLFITYSSSLVPTESVFDMQKFDPFQDVISTIIVGLIAFFIFCKKYHWNFKIMNKRVETTNTN